MRENEVAFQKLSNEMANCMDLLCFIEVAATKYYSKFINIDQLIKKEE